MENTENRKQIENNVTMLLLKVNKKWKQSAVKGQIVGIHSSTQERVIQWCLKFNNPPQTVAVTLYIYTDHDLNIKNDANKCLTQQHI